ncbi:MAG TPA: exodeoxyribonuclease VII large subunit [Phaeodactylibacter sp.]|nr:exodeoxyribonuclease VII large subunit [Phaeodactylibacter sp.]
MSVDETTYTLYELNEYVRRVLLLNFEEPLWIQCELSQVRESRGHFYLELIQQNDEDKAPIAQASGIIWSNHYRQLARLHGYHTLEQILSPGAGLRIKIKVDFHERYGYKLIVEDLDPDFTLGQNALKKQRTIEQLALEGRLEKNAGITLPFVLQRLAVLSSPEAAGYKDFVHQLSDNPLGYRFQITLFPTAVQGERTETEICAQLRHIAKRKREFDAALILRGGGSRTDLMAFDSYAIAKAISDMPLPVITGIGHEIDTSIADLVAHTAVKTPTAAAAFVLEHNEYFEANLLEMQRQINRLANQYHQLAQLRLNQLTEQIRWTAREQIRTALRELEQMAEEIPQLAHRLLQNHKRQLDFFQRQLQALDPAHILRRGFSITTYKGKAVLNAADLPKGAQIHTRFYRGTASSTIEKTQDDER